MSLSHDQQNEKRTPAAELSPELRARLLGAMLDLQQEIRRNIKLRKELTARLQPEPLAGAVIARIKNEVMAEVQCQRQNERALRMWRRSLAVAGAVGAVVLLLVSALIVFIAAPTQVAEEPEVVMAQPTINEDAEIDVPPPFPPPPGMPPVPMAKVTRIYAAQPLTQKCECPCEHPRKPGSTPCLMCEDTLQHESDDGSVLMIRVPHAIEFNMNEDVI